MNVQKFNDGYYVTRGDWKINGPFDAEQDALEFIDDLENDTEDTLFLSDYNTD